MLQNFISSFTTDVARPSRFLAIVVPTSTTLLQLLPTTLELRCENAELPARTFGTAEQKFGSNPTQKHPFHTSYNDLTLSFILSDNMQEKTFFDVWMEYINPSNTYDFNYKNEYTSTITVWQYDVADNITYAVQFINAYPIVVNQLDLDWSSDSVHKLTVVFAYDYWQLSVQSSNNFGLPLTNGTPSTNS